MKMTIIRVLLFANHFETILSKPYNPGYILANFLGLPKNIQINIEVVYMEYYHIMSAYTGVYLCALS